jgi:hypothetical protein
MKKGDAIEKRVGEAIKLFWLTRDKQRENQGIKSGTKDAGLRAAVTGGKHLDGFTDICRDLFIDAGVPEAHVFWKDRKELPGYYRAEKNWDLIVVADGHLLAVIEFKAQVGLSFGNNFNNRVEEALGNASDLWAAYREGALTPSARPWLGYVFILEDCQRSHAPIKVREPHFKVFREFQNASYAKRYEIFLTKLLRERLYDGACLLMTPRDGGSRGKFTSPSDELGFRNFAAGLSAHAIAFAKTHCPLAQEHPKPGSALRAARNAQCSSHLCQNIRPLRDHRHARRWPVLSQ